MTAPAKHPGGRPRLPPGEARTLRLPLRLTPAEHASLAAAAGGADLSTWVRETALRRARRAAR